MLQPTNQSSHYPYTPPPNPYPTEHPAAAAGSRSMATPAPANPAPGAPAVMVDIPLDSAGNATPPQLDADGLPARGRGVSRAVADVSVCVCMYVYAGSVRACSVGRVPFFFFSRPGQGAGRDGHSADTHRMHIYTYIFRCCRRAGNRSRPR